MNKNVRRFELVPNGDPYGKNLYDVREYGKSYSERFPIFRGDLSPVYTKRGAVSLLRSIYPGCRIRLGN